MTDPLHIERSPMELFADFAAMGWLVERKEKDQGHVDAWRTWGGGPILTAGLNRCFSKMRRDNQDISAEMVNCMWPKQ